MKAYAEIKDGNINKCLTLLRKIRLFSSLTEDELLKVIDKINIRRFKKGQTVIEQDDANNFMYVVIEGSVKVIQFTEDGKEIVLAARQAGEYFGELSLLDGKTTSATVSATSDCVVAIISKETFTVLLYSSTKIIDNLLQTLCMRLRGTIETIQMLNHHNACQRLRLFFEQLSKTCGQKTDKGIIISNRLTQQEIADSIGLARQTVTELMNDWKRKEEIVILKGKSILLTHKFIEEFLYKG
ncbi:MAG: Crp/Fnr family transcriptional regulator [Candidatus Magnetobacterium sp. LHC-1]|uniref:Crp/Fnr family transcriptional regulator n=1 Tax=Candidatus Magnetobacterium casense TaxID=1455061 RepID=A0ABS6RV20_9BACT|nr:Crp/Fnr family transcriptional regulator [Candidatus Magnetobacterium casensis]MBF0609077.1 Crp/Fnr family transcriptional regulator [Nitrospirota bacterium]MBV6340472.1 Crp/Fnr family transcriptional regulator [Candidatus Magnetobacterium casensis]